MLFKIILHYIDTAIFALRYFILLHLAYNLYEYNLDTINGAYVILYADDILLMSHSISMLQTLLTTCENELDTIGMAINTRKSCCIRVGPRYNIPCVVINTNDGSKLSSIPGVKMIPLPPYKAPQTQSRLPSPAKTGYSDF